MYDKSQFKKRVPANFFEMFMVRFRLLIDLNKQIRQRLALWVI